MRLALRPADQLEFCEDLTRRNLSVYLAARDTLWDSRLYLASWAEFENLVILADDRAAGVLRLWADDTALEIRDLQVDPARQGQGIGSWAVQQTKLLAADRGFGLVRLRVFEENPARALYLRLGFASEAIVGGKVHMSFALPPNSRFVARLDSGVRPFIISGGIKWNKQILIRRRPHISLILHVPQGLK